MTACVSLFLDVLSCFPPCCFPCLNEVMRFCPPSLECAEGRSPGAWVSALVAWLLCSAISGKGERSHQPRIFLIFLVLSRYCILKLFEVLGLTRFFEFCPLSGSSGARSRGSSLTRHEGSGCFPYPWRVVCESPCPEPTSGF